MDSNKNVITMAAQTYLQNNKSLVPKVIGETKNIRVIELRKANYLTENIKNSKGESCMENSYVRVYKLSKSEYTYTTFLYCGADSPEVEEIPSPVITAKFSDSSGEAKNERLKNVSDANLYIDIKAATDEEMQAYKNQQNEIKIDGYSFKLYVVKNGVNQEAYNSGSLSAGREGKVIINKKLKDYIDVTGITEISLEVTAINTIGGITTINTTVSENGDVSNVQYNDDVKPECISPNVLYAENDWINKQEYNRSKDARKLTIGCQDGTGSGCIRTFFTKSWPNAEDKYGAEYVYIEVKDNAGNISEHNDDCRFRVNVDVQTPSAKVTAYKGLPSNSNDTYTLSTKTTGSNKLKNTIKVSDSTPSYLIKSTDEYYSDLVGISSEAKWFNQENYPDGVVYKIELKDNLRLDKWTWLTNEALIKSTKADNYKEVNATNPEASSGVIAQDEAHGMTHMHGSTYDTIYVRFLTEGKRYGVLTVYDKAGNKIEINIEANIDRTAPPVPSKLKAYVFNKVRTEGTKASDTSYKFATWTNRYVRVETETGYNKDNLSQGVSLSGFWSFIYDARNDAGKSVGSGDYSTNSSGIGVYNFKGTAKEVDGKNKIRFKGCDNAGNCSSYNSYADVWIDITIPVCKVTKTITRGSESTYGWLGYGEAARVTAECTDPTTATPSGCTHDGFYHDYTYEINTNTAGALGDNNAGYFEDYAGNKVDCTATERIQIDYQYPNCETSGGSTTWTNTSRTVTGKCTDKGASGCVESISHTYNYNINTTSGGAAGDGKGGSVRDKADNVVKCDADQTVKVDQTPPYVTVDKDPGVYDNNDGIDVTITCNDTGGSGLSTEFDKTFSSHFYSPSTGGNIAKCCSDNAGNKMCDSKGLYKLRYYSRHEDCGVESYETCSTSACGVASCKTCTVYSGCESGFNLRTCKEIEGKIWSGTYGCCNSKKTEANCDVCGTNYKSCAHKDCGVKLYKECWHY